MKKIFYILAAAIVALGTVACENEGLDNINPNINVDGDTVSFVAGINRTDLDGTATIWDAEDIIVVTWNDVPYEFTNVGQEDENTFSCTAEGLSAIVNAESIKAVYSNKKDGKVDSAAGVAGALLEYEGAFGNIAFEVKNAFLKFTVADPVTLTASEGLFGEGTELVISKAGEHYVAINPVAATLEYKVGESMGKNLETTFEAKKIYNLGNLTKSIAGDSNGKYYTELATAFKLAESGATITLLEDIALEGLTEGALMKVDKNLTLNVGEHTLTATMPTATKNASIFTVTKGAEFTLVGAGNIVIENGGGSNIGNHFISNEGGIVNLDMDGGIELNVVGTPFINCIVDNNSTLGAATLNVKKGTYKQNSGNIFRNFVNHKTELATINISGGSIIGTGAKDIYIWNQKMSKTTGILNITAGTFVNVQIDNDDKTLNQVTFTAEGYTLQQNANGYFDVVEKTPVAGDDKGEFYTELADAFKLAESGATITLLEDITLGAEESGLTIANGKTFTLDLNGKTLSQVKECTKGHVLLNNNGTLTIEDNSSEKTGKIVMEDTGAGDPNFDWGTYAVRNNGTLTINGGTIETIIPDGISHCATALMLYAGKTTINDGNIICQNYRTIQGFFTPEVVINGGNFQGQVWMHETCSEDASLTINGGTFAPRGNDGSSVFLNNTKDIKLSITGGTFKTKVGCDDETKPGVVGAITGGKFTEDALNGGKTKALIANGYAAKLNGEYYEVVEWNPVASVDGVEYESFEAALEAVEAGSTIELLADIESEDIIIINKNITIDGNNKTINSTATRAINIATEGEVTIKNLIVEATGERAVNVITYPATVKLEGVNLTASNYTVNVATSAGAAKVDIQKSTLRGLNTVNINGAGAEVTIDGCEIYCNDNNPTKGEDYAALSLGMDAVDGSIVATNTNIYVTEGSDSTKGCNNADGGTITIDGSTDGVEVKYAAIIYGDYYYAFDTVDEAIEYDATKTIILLRDATIGTEGTYTIDVNGHELSPAENFILTDNHDGTYTVVAAKAKVGTTPYATLEAALTAANGATVTLLDHGIVQQACQIDKNGFTLTVNGDFYAANEVNGITPVKAKPVLRIDNKNGWGDLNVTIKSGTTTIVTKKPMTKEGNTTTFKYVLDGQYDNVEISYFIEHSWYQTSTKTTTVTANSSAITLNTTYLQPDVWNSDSPTFGAWLFGGGSSADQMVTGVKVKDGFFEFEIPSTSYTKVIFVRCNSKNPTASWDTKWNQTENLTLKHMCYCVNSWTQSDLTDSRWY